MPALRFVPRLESLERRDVLSGLLDLPATVAPVPALAGDRAASVPAAPLAQFERFVPQQIAQQHLAGVSVALVRRDVLLFARGYGSANFVPGGQMLAATPLLLASVSKTVTGVAVMQLVERGLLDLDRDINAYLPFAVRNPRHPEAPITARMLLTHTSSIRDNDPFPAVAYSRGDSPLPLGRALRDYLNPDGPHAEPDNFLTAKPGSALEYSNIGTALAGYLVEAISGRPFDRYCRDEIFRPLGMRHTSWKLAGLDPRRVAMPYEYRGGRLVAAGHYGFPDYPNGQLRSSALDMSRFLRACMNGGALDGRRILTPRSIAAMSRPQVPHLDRSQGLIWFYDTIGGVRALGHDGSEKGVNTYMFFRPRERVGIIVFSNTSAADEALEQRQSAALQAIAGRLFRLAR